MIPFQFSTLVAGRSTRLRPGPTPAVRDVATGDVVTIDSDAPLSQAARLMAERRSPHLIAVQPSTDRPVGVLSSSGLAAVLAWGGP